VAVTDAGVGQAIVALQALGYQIWPAAQAFSVAAKAIANDGMRLADELATGLQPAAPGAA
jgi:hypothetical protein